MANEKLYPERFEINQTIYDEHIELAKKVSPDYREQSLRLFKRGLGYLPSPYIYLPHLAFAQSLNENHAIGLVSDETYMVEAYALHQRIRNDDMKKNGWVRYLEIDQAYLDFYNSHLGIYKDAARSRLCSLMEYEPKLLYSVPAEILLRQLFESDEFDSTKSMYPIDYRAITIARYREVFITEGEQKADQSVLMGVVFREFEEKNKETK